jgi:hypothetical protein
MNFSNNQKLYFNVALLFIFTYLLASKVISGFKTNDFNYLRIGINVLLIGLTIRSIIALNKK